MQCPQCGFENMPGEARCFRCQSVLEAPPVADVQPPRAPAWSKPFRSAGRWARRFRGRRQAARAAKRIADAAPTPDEIRDRAATVDHPRMSSWFQPEVFAVLWRCALGLALSVIPGLAHIWQRRFRDVRWHALGWGVFLTLAIVLYASPPGVACFAIALALHAWIMVDASVGPFIRDENVLTRTAWRLGFLAGCAGFLFLGYQAIVDRATPRELVVAQAGVAVPFHRVELRDTLFCTRLDGRFCILNRGDMVAVDIGTYVVGGYYVRGGGRRATLPNPLRMATAGQLIAFPGETVEIRNNQFHVNGRPLDPDRFPVPQCLRGDDVKVHAAPAYLPRMPTYFVTLEYRAQQGRLPLNTQVARAAAVQACLLPSDSLVARAYMRWYPVYRRGYLRSAE